MSAALYGGKGGWDSGEIETSNYKFYFLTVYPVERVDGTQARLKLRIYALFNFSINRGKGGWDSGEIETSSLSRR